MIAVAVLAWRHLLRRIRSRAISRRKGFGLFALAVLTPALLCLGLMLALIGIEELTGLALIQEEIARSLLPVMAFGVLVWMAASVLFLLAVIRKGRT